MTSYEERRFIKEHQDAVKRGVALLDEVSHGWERDIDLDILDLGSTTCCMLGQLHGSYSDGCDKLTDALTEARIRFEKAERSGSLDSTYYGFEAQHWAYEWPSPLVCTRKHGYSILTEEWTKVIVKRLDRRGKP